MNRRLLRTTYHVEIEEVTFTHGLPAWMTEGLTGSSTGTTHNYTAPYGSHYAMNAKGSVGNWATLSGTPFSTSVVKILELEAIGITLAGPAEITLGFAEPSDTSTGIRLEAVPADLGVAHAGRVRLVQQVGNKVGETTLFSEGKDKHLSDSATSIEDLDIAVIVDSEAKTSQAHLGYSYVSCGPEGFPVDQVLAPTLKANLLADGEATVKVRKVRIGTYT